MAQQHVVFINMGAAGHINPTLPVVAELRSRGVAVTYFVPEKFRKVIEDAGADWQDMEENDELNEEMRKKYVPPGMPEEETRFPMSTLPFAACQLPQLMTTLRSLTPCPTLIAHDPFLPHPLVAAKILGLPAVSVLTMPGPGVLARPAAATETWEANAMVQKAREEIRSQYDVDVFAFGSLMEFYSPHRSIVTTIDSLFVPPAPGMQRERFGRFPFTCVGPLVDAKVKRISHPLASARPSGGLPWERIDGALASGKRLAMVSMGTVANSHWWSKTFGEQAANNGLQDCTGKDIVQFVFRNVFEALGEEEDLLVVLAVGPQADALEGLPAPPANFIVQETLPQIELLPRCHAFLTHCGANSMHEALGFGVPLVVVPLFGDQIPNGRAVAENGAGVTFTNPLTSLSAEALRSAFRQLLADGRANPFYAAAQALSSKMRAAGGVSKAADVLLETAMARQLASAGA